LRKSFALAGMVMLGYSTYSQDVGERDLTPKYSNDFLSIGVGARALGMSNSQAAISGDVTSVYWNPAGILAIENSFQVGLMHSEYFAGIAKYDYVGVARPVDRNSSIGMAIIRFAIDDIPNTIDLIDAEGNVNYDRISTFSAADYAALFTYAARMPVKNLRAGANFKIIHRRVGDFARSWGFGLDVGAQYKHENWVFGAMGRDITTTFNAWSYDLSDRMLEVFQLTGNAIPEASVEITLPRLILGVGRTFEFGNDLSLQPALDVDLTFDGKRNTLIPGRFASIDPHLGFEFGYKQLVFLRGGIGNFQRVSEVEGKEVLTFQPNLGVGVHYRGVTLDYALTDIGDLSVALFSNVFSLRVDVDNDNNRRRR